MVISYQIGCNYVKHIFLITQVLIGSPISVLLKYGLHNYILESRLPMIQYINYILQCTLPITIMHSVPLYTA